MIDYLWKTVYIYTSLEVDDGDDDYNYDGDNNINNADNYDDNYDDCC